MKHARELPRSQQLTSPVIGFCCMSRIALGLRMIPKEERGLRMIPKEGRELRGKKRRG